MKTERARRLHAARGLYARPGNRGTHTRGQQNQVKGNGHPSDVPKLLLAALTCLYAVYAGARDETREEKQRRDARVGTALTLIDTYTFDINPLD